MTNPLDAWRSPVTALAAHRGGLAEGPENTLLCTAKGLAAGATHVEIDVRGTEDGVPVLMHDRTAERTCLDERAIATMTLDEVKQLDPCVLWSDHADIATGDRPPQEGFPRSWYQVPTLTEFLDAFPGVPLIVDLKDTAPPEATAEALREAWRDPRNVLLSGYDDDVLDETARHLPEAARGAGRSGAERFYEGEDVEADVLIVPPQHEGLELIHEDIIERAHEEGMGFWVWTINNRDFARQLMDVSVDGIITDAPRKLSRERRRRIFPS